MATAQLRTVRVFALCGSFEPGFRGGGPVRSLAHIVDTAPPHIALTLVVNDRDLGSRTPYPGLSGQRIQRGHAWVHYLNIRHPGQWLRLLREQRSSSIDLLYCSSFWSLPFTAVPLLAVRLGLLRPRQILLAPRGELMPGSLAQKARKKHVALRVWGALVQGLRPVWHATSELEADSIRRQFPSARVLVNDSQSGAPQRALPPPVPHDGPARLVFLGRLSPKKNLALALAGLRTVRAPIDFDIYGPVEDMPYWQYCRELMAQLPPNVRARYRGAVAPDQARETFAGYDAFLFPTQGENFGHTIVESLSASCPVICSEYTPWTAVLRDGGGTVLATLDAGEVCRAVDRLGALSTQQRRLARVRAGESYDRWRSRHRERNVLEQATENLLSEALPR
jgi:glycosyltransferase involved in cell wall biosynthesis